MPRGAIYKEILERAKEKIRVGMIYPFPIKPKRGGILRHRNPTNR